MASIESALSNDAPDVADSSQAARVATSEYQCMSVVDIYLFAMQRREPDLGYIQRLDYSPPKGKATELEPEACDPIPSYEEAMKSAPVPSEKELTSDKEPPLKLVRSISHTLSNKIGNMILPPIDPPTPISSRDAKQQPSLQGQQRKSFRGITRRLRS